MYLHKIVRIESIFIDQYFLYSGLSWNIRTTARHNK